MSNILAAIIEQKKIEVKTLNLPSLRRDAEQSPPTRNFLSAIKPQTQNHVRLIAELKRASPSKGVLAPHIDLFQVAEIYAYNGAAAISVLTDEKFFQGSIGILRDLRNTNSISLPLLRKDFIIDESQIYEARVNGADAILLIVAALKDSEQLNALHTCAQALGMSVLVEVHSQAEIERAMKIKNIQIIGINNRNLATFDVSLNTTEQLRPIIPPGITIVAESGIFNINDVERVSKANVDAILVGEALITAPDIAKKVRELSGIDRH